MMSYWVILISSVLAAAYASPSCDAEEIVKCGLHMDDSNQFPTNAFDLNQQCSDVKPKFQCIADFMERCPNDFTTEIRKFYRAAFELTTRICDGNLHDKYLRNAQCFGSVMKSKQPYCDEKYNHLIIEKGICAYKNAFTKCVATFVDTCGPEALELFYEVGKATKFLYVKDHVVCP